MTGGKRRGGGTWKTRSLKGTKRGERKRKRRDRGCLKKRKPGTKGKTGTTFTATKTEITFCRNISQK